MLIDSHAHLQDKKFARDLERVLGRARDAGIARLICIADDLPSSRQALALARRHPGLFATAGIHPHNERRFKEDSEEEIRRLARSKKVVAIGEVGLDFHWPGFNKERQIEILALQGRIATDRRLPLVLHCRDAYPELIDFFRRENDITSRGVVHCFSGSLDQAKSLLDLGFYLGIGGTITYPNARELRETIGRIGLDRIVCETDSPYLPPQKKRGRRNEPSYMKFTVKALADAAGLTYQDVARITTANAARLHGLEEESDAALAYAVRNRLYLNITNRCTNECCYCERSQDYRLHGHYLKLEGEPSAEQILEAIEEPEQFEEMVICGLGEPTLRLDVVLQLARELKGRGCRVRLNTNGHGNMIHERDITPEFSGLLDAVAITMNAQDCQAYNEISRPLQPENSFDAMIDFTRRAKECIPDVRMKLLALPQVDVEACRKIAEDDLQVRFQVRAPRPDGYPLPIDGAGQEQESESH